MVASVLDIAQSEGMKVILLCADHSPSDRPEMGSTQADADDYEAYLRVLANVIKNKPALLAYDLYNEPTFMSYGAMGDKGYDYKKGDVCSFVKQWYNGIKDVDKNHLITINGTDPGDVLFWDPGVMKVDFMSMHLYPSSNPYTQANSQVSFDRVINEIKWCSNTLQTPWIIGETGFTTAGDSWLNDNLDGSMQEQKDYLSQILPAMRDCGGSGFSWWEFQDAHYFCVSTNYGHLTDNCTDCSRWDCDNTYYGNYYGLLQYGDPVFTGGNIYDPSIYKPAIDVTQAFNFNTANNTLPALATCPTTTTSYYNPYNHTDNEDIHHVHTDQNGNVIYPINGNIVDANYNPIENAVIVGYTPVNTNSTGQIIYDVHTTFTEANGNFTIIPYDYDPINNPNSGTIDILKISAIGSSHEVRSPGLGGTPVTNNEQFVLDRSLLNYENTIASSPVASTTYQAGSILNVAGNITVPNTLTVDYKARSEVNISSEFHATTGSEVHIYCETTSAECSDFGTYRKSILPAVVADNNTASKGEIEIRFKKTPPILDFAIQPNPNNGNFSLTVEQPADMQEVKGLMEVYTLLGTKVYSQQIASVSTDIDFSWLSKGIYYVRLKTEVKTISKKLIIQ